MLKIGYVVYIICSYIQPGCNSEAMAVNSDLYFYTGPVRTTKIQNIFEVNFEHQEKEINISVYTHLRCMHNLLPRENINLGSTR